MDKRKDKDKHRAGINPARFVIRTRTAAHDTLL